VHLASPPPSVQYETLVQGSALRSKPHAQVARELPSQNEVKVESEAQRELGA